MNAGNHPTWSRREFLRGLAIAGGAGLFGLQSRTVAAEPPPEITTIRLMYDPEIPKLCYAPQYVAEELLRVEGFTDVRYVPYGLPELSEAKTLARGQADINAALVADLVAALDNGDPITILAGLHVGCLELFANDSVSSISDLKHKRVAVPGLGGAIHIFLAGVAAYIGLDPQRDIEWVLAKPKDWGQLLVQGKVDAIGALPPMSYDINAQKIGHVILNTTTDEPWRYYFCCMIAARRDFVRNYPIATKRALRAILKANQLCGLQPERTARWLLDRKYATDFGYALSTLRDIPYDAWRDYDPEDTLRFFSLRLREAGINQRTPQEIIAQGTDWRFLNELKRELKA